MEEDFNFQDLELFVGTKMYTVESAPVGLLILEDGTVICKSEYRSNDSADCTIVDSGENYCGGDKPCKALRID